jgi:WD40 repeat protein
MCRVFPAVVAALVLFPLSAQAKKPAPCKPRNTVELPGGGVRSVVFLPDGKTVAAATEDGSLVLVDGAKGKVAKTFKGHKGAAYSLAVSPDGKLAATGGEDKRAILWELPSGKQRATLSGHDNTVRSVAFSPDGSSLYTASLDKQLGEWNPQTGANVRMMGGQACILMGVAVSRGKLKDGSPFAGAACHDGLVRIWNLQSGKPQFALEGHEGEVHAVAFSPAGDGSNPQMATGDNDGNVLVWNVRAQKAELTLSGGWTDAVAFSPDGTLVVGAGNDMAQKGIFRLWSLPEGKLLNEQEPHDGNIGGVSFSPDGKSMVTGGNDGMVKLWDVAQLKKGCG